MLGRFLLEEPSILPDKKRRRTTVNLSPDHQILARAIFLVVSTTRVEMYLHMEGRGVGGAPCPLYLTTY